MQEEFFRKFIEEERYLQNAPMKTDDFIDFCKKRGIETDEYELEFFEKNSLLYPVIRIDRPIVAEDRIKFKKDGKPFWRPGFQLQEGETEIKRYQGKYYSAYGFSTYDKQLVLDLFANGHLYDPSNKPFQKWSFFDGDRLENGREKIISFYSSFQIHWLEILKNDFMVKINFAGEKIRISSNSYCKGPFNPGSFSINDIDEFNEEYKEVAKDKGKHYFSFENKKKCLKTQYKNFNKILELFLSIQFIYYPYGRSSSKTISVRDENWHEKRSVFDVKKALEESGFTIKEIANFYGLFSEKTRKILGVERDDWVQLWKSLAWDEKDKLEGPVRLGIEYLQWSLMLKRFIEDYCGREILDIDEISNISRNDILKYDPSEMEQYGILFRASRLKYYSDPEKNKNYFYDKYKRLFYLANDFKIDYQPRIMVFVEGETEETFFPKLFEWYYDYPENHGIEFVNFKGVDQLLSTSKNVRKLRNLIKNIEKEQKKLFISKTQKRKLNELIRDLKETDIVISNWTSFISFNLEKWQIIPFFVSDNEGNVKHFLDAEKPIKFGKETYDVPNEWKYLWGEANENSPFEGNNFEFANFSDEEIMIAFKQVLNDEIDINQINEIRETGQGIKKIDERLNSRRKREVVSVLFNNLFKEYEEKEDRSLLERPIFKLIEVIVDLARFNPPPVNTEIELMNKKYISDLLNGKIER